MILKQRFSAGINIFKLDDILASIESGSSDQATSVTPLHRVNTQGGRPQWVRLAARDRKVVVGLAGGEGSGGGGGGGVWVWSLKDLASAKVSPMRDRGLFMAECLTSLSNSLDGTATRFPRGLAGDA